jgi:CheY-like chemotaxis protein
MFLLDERNFIPNLSVYIDTDVLKTVFGVLIRNAIKYTDKGFVKIGYRVLEKSILQFFVEDTGNGFEPDALEKITGALDSPANGANVKTVENLLDVNMLVKSAGGKVRIESQQGMGTTVFFNVDYKPEVVGGIGDDPKAQDTSQQASQDSSSQSKSNPTNNIWTGKTILIAEDEIVNYMFLEVLFEETGATLIHACDGQQAIDAVKNNSNIDLILMDIKMPNVNGLDATRQIKAIRSQLPIIAQTAYAMQDDEYKALQAGCNEYISKPIDANKLIGLMKKYLK